MKKRVDLVSGNIIGTLITLSLPILGTSFIQMAYNLVDMIWIGKAGSAAVAAIGTAGFFSWFGNSLVLIKSDKCKYDIKSLKDLLKYDITMAIGQIDTVPAGQYAKESLEKLNIFNEIKDKLVYGKDVSAVKNYVETSEVDLGIVYKSDSFDLKSRQVVLEIPKNLHENINYTLAPINSSEDGKKIIEFINSKYSKKILREYGFLINE